jgi:peroxiredoxin
MKKLPVILYSRKKIITIGIFILLILSVAMILTGIFRNKLDYNSSASNISDGTFNNINVGSKAPDFELDNVLGGMVKLSQFRRYTVLLSFIQVHSTIDMDDAKDTRSQLTFLKSMNAQYGSKGLRVILVDAAYIKHKKNDSSTKINFTYDWMLKNIPLLSDTDSTRVARIYNVEKLPTTLLINKDGLVTQRWDGLALTSQLASGIEALVGGPDYRKNDGSNDTITSLDTSPWSTPAQAKFPGYLPARQFSDNIWAIDGGRMWSGRGQFPVTWIVLNKSGKLTIKVTAKNIQTGKTVTILGNQKLKMLPESDANTLLTNFPNIKSSVYKIDTLVALPGTGKMELEATVYEEGKETPILAGKAKVVSK